MERQQILDRVETRMSDPLSINVRGFDGVGYERHANVEHADLIEPVTSPAALAFYIAARKAAGGCRCRDPFCDCQITV